MEALGCIGHPDDVALIDSVLGSGRLSFQAGFALAKNPAPEALAALLARSKDPREAVARGAIGGLGERGDQAARPSLESLLSSSLPNVRYAAVLALGQLGVEPSRKALEHCLQSETNADVKGKLKEVLHP